MKEMVFWMGIVAAFLSAVSGGYAAFGAQIRNKQQEFLSDLESQSHWASYAAAAAGISVLAQAIERSL